LRIYRLVQERPGLSIREVAGALDISHSTASYHLAKLAEQALINGMVDGNKVRYYKSRSDLSEEDKRFLAIMKSAETVRVLQAIKAHKDCMRVELKRELGVTSPTIAWHLRKLFDTRLVRERGAGKGRFLQADEDKLTESLNRLRTYLPENVTGLKEP
jgi:predicted transcriptional regulator